MNDVRIVLVETSHPGNIGAVARAMKTMGLTQLRLVRPRCAIDAEAAARASGAGDILTAAQYYDDLDSASQDCALVIGASARLRSLPWPVSNPRQCVERIVGLPAGCRVAAVFGRERSGLSNRELVRCGLLMHIPTSARFSSLNIAAAVQVFAYELRMGFCEQTLPPARKDAPASAGDVARFYEHLQQVMTETGFLDADNPRQVMRRLKRLFVRAELETVEVNILRGILTAVQSSMARRSS